MRDWNKEPREIQEFAAKFGIGPLYKPVEPKRHVCPECGKNNAIWKERHPDTSMNEMLLCCPDCCAESEKGR